MSSHVMEQDRPLAEMEMDDQEQQQLHALTTEQLRQRLDQHGSDHGRQVWSPPLDIGTREGAR